MDDIRREIEGGEEVYKLTICGGRSRGVKGYRNGRYVEGDRGGEGYRNGRYVEGDRGG